MNVELVQLRDGRLALMSDQSFPADVKRVEYYRDQKLFMLVYEGQDHTDLLDRELSGFAADIVRRGPGSILVLDVANPHHIHGFDVPLIHVGV